MQATKTAPREMGREIAHILVVDDEKSICELLEITFRKEGHRVEVANSVEAAKRKLEGSLYDIVISVPRASNYCVLPAKSRRTPILC